MHGNGFPNALPEGRIRTASESGTSFSRHFIRPKLDQRSSSDIAAHASLEQLSGVSGHGLDSDHEIDFMASFEKLHLQEKQKIYLLRRQREHRPSQQVLAIKPSAELSTTTLVDDQPAGDDYEDSTYWTVFHPSRLGSTSTQVLPSMRLIRTSEYGLTTSS